MDTVQPIDSPELLRVVTINKDSDSLTEALGLDKERVRKLKDLMILLFKENRSYSDIAAFCSATCIHPNEIVFIGVVIGSIIEKKRDPLQALLMHLGNLKES